MIEADLSARLLADVTLSSIIGSGVFPVVTPQGHTGPHVVYGLSNSQRASSTVCGASTSVEAEYQIDCISKSYFQAKEIADAVRESLNGFAGQMGQTTIDRVLLETDQDLFDPEPGLFRVSQTFQFFYQES